MEEIGYNGWSNRDTWAMALNLSNDYATYQACESAARRAAPVIDIDSDPRLCEDLADEFHEDLAKRLETLGRAFASEGMLPDFDPDSHESPDPKDNHGPDDIDGVNWREIADQYQLSEYV